MDCDFLTLYTNLANPAAMASHERDSRQAANRYILCELQL